MHVHRIQLYSLVSVLFLRIFKTTDFIEIISIDYVSVNALTHFLVPACTVLGYKYVHDLYRRA